jgi:hypothetical protein
VQLLAEGKSNKEVADLMGISVKNAETHAPTSCSKWTFTPSPSWSATPVRNKMIQSQPPALSSTGKPLGNQQNFKNPAKSAN